MGREARSIFSRPLLNLLDLLASLATVKFRFGVANGRSGLVVCLPSAVPAV